MTERGTGSHTAPTCIFPSTTTASSHQQEIFGIRLMKSSIRKLRRRFHRRDTNKDGTSTKTGDTATGVVGRLPAGDQDEDRKKGQENRAVDDGLNHQGESVEAASTPSEYEIRSYVREKPATVSWSQYYSEHREEILEGFRTFFSIGETITAAIPFPGSDIIFGALTSFVERVQIIGENNEARKELLVRVSNLKIEGDPNLWPDTSMLALKAFESRIVEQLYLLLNLTEQRGRLANFFLAEVDMKRFEAFDASITKAIQDLLAVLLAGNTTTLGRVKDGVDDVDEKVDELSYAQAKLRFEQSLRNVTEKLSELAAYDVLRPRPIDTCYEGTCDNIQEKIKEWATCNDDNGKQLMWLSGLAGTGKSTLAKTIATWADKEKNFLGSSYFFLRGDMKLGKPALVIPTIAYHLSGFDPSLTEHIEKRLEEKNGYILHQEFTEQFKKLIEEPLAQKPELPRKRALLIVDGLDECEDGVKLKVIINLLLSLPSPTNFHIRILLVSRPEKHILEALCIGSRFHPNVEHLAVEHFVERSDIEAYLRHGISEVTKSQNGARFDIWPEEIHFQLLVDSCGKLFVYASTVIGFIDEGVRGLRSREESLDILLNVNPDGASDEEPYKNLDRLYQQILLTAVGGEETKLGSKRVQRLRKILEAIGSLRNPLGVRSISILLEEGEEKQRLEERQIWNAVKLLSSVLIVPVEVDYNTPIRVFHPSLLDFLTDKGRCDDERFFIDVADHGREAILFQRCLEIIISKGLSGQVDKTFFQVLEYACVFWGDHLEKASHEDAKVIKELEMFVKYHHLKWFRFARVFISKFEPLLRCLEIAQNWVSGHDSKLSDTLNSMLRSSRVLWDGLFDWPTSTYHAARSKCGDVDTRRTTCKPGTRVALLDEIMECVTANSAGPKILWLHGSAYTGKSAVAMSIAEWADENGVMAVTIGQKYLEYADQHLT
ncbi:hypothetical protein SCHPADRAFT_945135 [Schizopora paradoxa]|uniref:NACHT domain-containing protein n=1 Tax=Schizopora paradoxa TaxID=27342 RepID=A0A0H2R709_9AGAM|nr:hypothetical protein SCHPADRAFT_945135 [Schizopora paradoxa]